MKIFNIKLLFKRMELLWWNILFIHHLHHNRLRRFYTKTGKQMVFWASRWNCNYRPCSHGHDNKHDGEFARAKTVQYAPWWWENKFRFKVEFKRWSNYYRNVRLVRATGRSEKESNQESLVKYSMKFLSFSHMLSNNLDRMRSCWIFDCFARNLSKSFAAWCVRSSR